MKHGSGVRREAGTPVHVTDAQEVSDIRLPFDITPIRQVHVYREVFRQLDGLVSSMRPGDRLSSERDLAGRLHVSRVSVREALRALQSTGKVEVRRNAGTYVLDPEGLHSEHIRGGLPADAAYLGWLAELRSAIEVKVVELVGTHGADLAPVRRLLEQAVDELDRNQTAGPATDLRFEGLLAQLVGNPLLQRTQRMVHRLWVTAWSDAGLPAGDRRGVHREHEAILAALESGDATLATRLTRDHVGPPVVVG